MINANNILSDDFLDSKRLLGDPEADAFIKKVFQNAEQKEFLQNWLKNKAGNSGINTLVEKFPGTRFIADAAYLPAWANSRLIKTGSVFFSKHSESIMSLLGLLSLPYCYTAANGAMVLYFSERIRKETSKRLFETAEFVWEVMAPDAFESEGKAFTEILKVRLIHAAVRYYTLQSGKWDQAWGVPVNQEDMAGTNLSFSLIVVRGLRLLGFSVSREDQEAFLHLWNVIGYLTGLEAELIAKTPKNAQQLDKVISNRQFRPSAHGKELARSLTNHIISVNKSKASDKDILGLMRYLLGADIADQLAISQHQLPAYKLSMLRAINLLKSFRPNVNPSHAYRTAYQAFRLQKPL